MDGGEEERAASPPPAESAGEGETQPSEEAPPAAEQGNEGGSGDVIGSAALRPVFLGNLITSYSAGLVQELFEKPMNPPNADGTFTPIPVDRIDLKRGYCFVFLKDATSQSDKDNCERFVSAINGM